MGAALSVIILFTVSSTVVRVMSVVLEHTGVPQSIARIQVLSAFSGTGFTTTESEILLQTPERRRILTILMIAGSVGLASISATIIVGALGVADTAQGIAKQLAFMVVALVFVRYVIFAGNVDSLVCGFAFRWLRRNGFEVSSYTVLHRLSEDFLIAEHWLADGSPKEAQQLETDGLQFLGQRHLKDQNKTLTRIKDGSIEKGSTILTLGSRKAHDAFASRYGSLEARGEH